MCLHDALKVSLRLLPGGPRPPRFIPNIAIVYVFGGKTRRAACRKPPQTLCEGISEVSLTRLHSRWNWVSVTPPPPPCCSGSDQLWGDYPFSVDGLCQIPPETLIHFRLLVSHHGALTKAKGSSRFYFSLLV